MTAGPRHYPTLRGIHDSQEPAPSSIAWIDYRQQKPELPETPFEVYLVWVVQQIPEATGTSELLQFSRDDNDWVPLSPGYKGAKRVVTHWSKALQVLSTPGTQFGGPRGREYM